MNAPDGTEPDIHYRTRPFVCGAIGDRSDSLLTALTAAAPTELEFAVRSEGLAVLSSGPLTGWRAGDGAGHCWGALASGPPPRGWRDASEGWMTVGVESGNGYVALHGDALGMQDLYYRRVGDAVYFSTRIDPLVGLNGDRLHIDWANWASTLAMTAPVGEHTPFEEIRRLTAATAWIWQDGRLRRESFEPSWTAEEIDPRYGPDDAVATLANFVSPRKGTVITLSGGWDSRLLGILARRGGRHLHAWTTSADDGRDRDVEFAGPVAKALGMRHHVLIPDQRAWLENYTEVRLRTGFQTIHHPWIMPLAKTLHRKSKALIDGLAGDVLFKTSFLTEAMLTERNHDRLWPMLWAGLEQRRLQANTLLRPEVTQSFIDLNRGAFRTAMEPFAGHHAAATLGKLHTRAARAIACSPQWLMAPELELQVPFLNREVLKAAMRVPLTSKADGEFYRRMLDAADPRIAALPSTNSVRLNSPRGPRRHTSPESLKALTDHIRGSEVVMSLLNPVARRAMLDPEAWNLIGTTMAGLRTLNWASLFGHWMQTYESALIVEEFQPDHSASLEQSLPG